MPSIPIWQLSEMRQSNTVLAENLAEGAQHRVTRTRAATKARIEKMKLSARNILPGKVVAVTKGTTTAHVKVELAPGLVVFSAITNEAVDDLALKVGDTVSAVIKSSDVMIGK
jgi:molybdopterin-binding protein